MEDENWIDNHSIRIPWLNFLTAQSIPEEIDGLDYSKRQHTDSGCSSSSEDDSYVVLEVQRPRSIRIEPKLNFAHIHRIKHSEFAQPLVIETPLKRNATEYLSELLITPEQCTPVIHSFAPSKEISHEQQRNSMISLHSIEDISYLSKQDTSMSESKIFTRSFAFDHTCLLKFPNAEKSSDSISKLPILRLVKKRQQIIKSEYYSSTNEPSLLQMKYLDGRPTLIDLNALESLSKSHISSSSSYRKRILKFWSNLLPSSFGRNHRSKTQ